MNLQEIYKKEKREKIHSKIPVPSFRFVYSPKEMPFLFPFFLSLNFKDRERERSRLFQIVFGLGGLFGEGSTPSPPLLEEDDINTLECALPI